MAVAAGGSPSWTQVVLDTIRLWWDRRHNNGRRRSRLWVPILCALVVIGGGLAVNATFGSADRLSSDAASAAPSSSLDQQDEPAGFANRSTGDSSRAVPSRTASLARAAAGAEIANRADIDVTPAAAQVLRDGTVDGRVLIVMASLATAELLTSVEMAPGEPVDAANVELGVVDVDRVLDWLDVQSRLRPDRLEVRRDGPVTRLRLIYESQEPPGLFPS